MFGLVIFQFASQLFSFCQFLLFVRRYQNFGCSIWICFTFLRSYLPTKHVKQGCLTCKSSSKVKGCPNSFLGSFFSVLPKDLLIYSIFPSLPIFQCQLGFFNLTFIQVFGRFVGLSSLDCSLAPLVHQ